MTSCHRSYLTCRTEYLLPPYLASVQINTPDPNANCFLGQQIIVRWRLPRKCLGPNLMLRLQIRYGNRELQTLTVPIKTVRGWWVQRILNDDYFCKCGILAFKAEILQGECIVAEWNHYLWADIINISENQ